MDKSQLFSYNSKEYWAEKGQTGSLFGSLKSTVTNDNMKKRKVYQ